MKPSDLNEATQLLDRLTQCDRLLGAETLVNSVRIWRDRQIDMDELSRIRQPGDMLHTDHEGTMSCGEWRSPFITVNLDAQTARDLVIDTRHKTMTRLRDIGVETAESPSDEAASGSPALPQVTANRLFNTPPGTGIFTQHSRRVWVQNGLIVTSNADGGTTAWSQKEARALAKSLAEILAAVDGFREDQPAAQKKSGGAEAPPPSDLPWYRRPPA